MVKYNDGLLKNVNNCDVLINFDGVTVNKENYRCLWPISCCVVQIKSEPFMIGAYYGSKELNNINSYLMEYVQEVQI